MLKLITLLLVVALSAHATLSSTTSRSQYTGNGGTASYAYSFRVVDDDDLLVTVRNTSNSETTLTKTTHYTVTGVGNATGTIALVDGDFAWQDSDGDLLTGYIISIRRVRELKQTTDIRNQGRYYPSLHEDTFDHLVMLSQQLQDQVSRSAKLSETTNPANVNMTLPVPVASRAIGWNAAADGLANIATVGAVAFSAFGESLVDDVAASDARTTLGAQQLTNDLTAETAPASGDAIPLYDASASANRKMTLVNVLKVINDVTEDSSPEVGDYLATYDISASAAKKAMLGAALARAGKAGDSVNFGMVNATTSTANDSIKIQGASAALSATNPLYVNMPSSTTAGTLAVLSATANVTVKITGAHFGLGTLGDFSAIELRLYAINDAGTLKWGVATKGGYKSITVALSSATATDINLNTEMLVNSTLTGTSSCVEVGYFLGGFADAGDVWTVSSTVGAINVGVPVPDKTDWLAFTPTASWTSDTTSTGHWRRVGDEMVVTGRLTFGPGTPGPSTDLTLTLPTGYKIDITKMSTTNANYSVGTLGAIDAGVAGYPGFLRYGTTTTVAASYITATSVFAAISLTAPFSFANADEIDYRYAVPIVGWSSN